jgi:hypothetical protein
MILDERNRRVEIVLAVTAKIWTAIIVGDNDTYIHERRNGNGHQTGPVE